MNSFGKKDRDPIRSLPPEFVLTRISICGVVTWDLLTHTVGLLPFTHAGGCDYWRETRWLNVNFTQETRFKNYSLTLGLNVRDLAKKIKHRLERYGSEKDTTTTYGLRIINARPRKSTPAAPWWIIEWHDAGGLPHLTRLLAAISSRIFLIRSGPQEPPQVEIFCTRLHMFLNIQQLGPSAQSGRLTKVT